MERFGQRAPAAVIAAELRVSEQSVQRCQADKILATPALLPSVNRAAYQHMLTDCIVVANLLQPGPGYGATSQDDTAWTAAMNASSINIS